MKIEIRQTKTMKIVDNLTEMGFTPYGTKDLGVAFAVSNRINDLPKDQKREVLEQLQNWINSQKKQRID